MTGEPPPPQTADLLPLVGRSKTAEVLRGLPKQKRHVIGISDSVLILLDG